MTRIKKLFRKKVKKPGMSPGTIGYSGEAPSEPICLRLIHYNASEMTPHTFENIDDMLTYKDKPGVKWFNIDGLYNAETLHKIQNAFGIHPLAMEDISNTDQRPKIDDYEDHIFVVVKMVYYSAEHEEVLAEQISFVLGKDYVFSFQEKRGDVFSSVRERLRGSASGNLRKNGPDYLLYALLDAIVDHYFLVLEKISESLEELDDEVTEGPTQKTLAEANALKKEIVYLRKIAWPLREIFNSLTRSESKLIKKGTLAFLRDVYDHTTQILETIEIFREMVSSIFEMYQSSQGNRMNQVMKVLTVIATIFMPPTFIAGIYGMNFDYMPELHNKYGYFVALFLMISSMTGMLVYFRKKGWY